MQRKNPCSCYDAVSQYIPVLDLVYLIHEYKLEYSKNDVSNWLNENSKLLINKEVCFRMEYSHNILLRDYINVTSTSLKCDAQDVVTFMLTFDSSILAWWISESFRFQIVEHIHTLGKRFQLEVLLKCCQ